MIAAISTQMSHPDYVLYPPKGIVPSPYPVMAQPQPVAVADSHVVGTASLTPAPTVPASQSAASSPTPAPASASVAPSTLPQMVSGLIDPVTGITYQGYFTPDAQTLYNAGSLVVNGNQLTSQGSALAAQGDLITGTPAPTTAQIAAASAAVTAVTTAAATSTTGTFSDIETWLGAETYIAGVPNGALLAGAAILGSMLFGGKKGRR